MCFVVSTTILEQFRRYDIFWNSSDGTIYFGTVQTVRYILFFILFIFMMQKRPT